MILFFSKILYAPLVSYINACVDMTIGNSVFWTTLPFQLKTNSATFVYKLINTFHTGCK